MKKIIITTLLGFCLFELVACSGKTIGKISGAENDLITINNVVYELDNNTGFSNADKDKYLGKVTNSKITMKVYSVKGDTDQNYIYTLWDWEGTFYKRQE